MNQDANRCTKSPSSAASGALLGERVEHILAHAHQRQRRAGRVIEPAHQLLALRLGLPHQSCRLVLGGIGEKRPRGVAERRQIRAEAGRRAGQELQTLRGAERGVAGQNRLGERDARSLAAPGEQRLRQTEQALDARRPGAPVADQRAPALGHRLQQPAEKRDVGRSFVHSGPSRMRGGRFNPASP